MTDGQQVKQLALLRAAVGLLGEQAQSPWWTSTFCGTSGKAFLSPVFPRTHVLAQLQGVTSAASLVHDEGIGVGSVFHLFRLPEDLEQGIHAVAIGEAVQEIADVMRSADSATRLVETFSNGTSKDAWGPVNVGPLLALRQTASWRDVAAYYFSAFEGQRKIFPFFSDRT